ncbi:hypothetical protein LQW54_006552 [Pestalotiopsis sp. IQ-011]
MGEQAAEPAGKAAGDTSDMSFMFVPQTLSKKARSHAMKEHWKQRRRDKREKESAGHGESTSSKVRRMSFNPLLDVWLPLDLSNAASFNAMMANSAAHLSMMQGKRNSPESLHFKDEALRIIGNWLTESSGAPSDEIIAAVLRLMSYEV